MGGRDLSGVLILLGLWVSSYSYALVGLGSISLDAKQYQKSVKAEKRYVEYAPFMSLNYKYSLTTRHEFIPEIGLAWHPSPSPSHSRMSVFLLYALSSRLWSSHRLHYGFGNLITRIHGRGGRVLMNNGNTTDVFFKPGGDSLSHTSVALVGYEFRLQDFLSLRLDVLTRPIFSKIRTYGVMISTQVYYF